MAKEDFKTATDDVFCLPDNVNLLCEFLRSICGAGLKLSDSFDHVVEHLSFLISGGAYIGAEKMPHVAQLWSSLLPNEQDELRSYYSKSVQRVLQQIETDFPDIKQKFSGCCM